MNKMHDGVLGDPRSLSSFRQYIGRYSWLSPWADLRGLRRGRFHKFDLRLIDNKGRADANDIAVFASAAGIENPSIQRRSWR